MTTGKRILVAFAFALLAIAAVGGVAYWSATAIGARLTDVTDGKLPTVNAVWSTSAAHTDLGRNVTALLLRRGDAGFRAKALNLANAAAQHIDESIGAYEALPHSDAAVARWRDAMAKLRESREQAKIVIGLVGERDLLLAAGMDKDSAQVAELDGRCWSEFLKLRALYTPASEALDATVKQAFADAEAAKEVGAAAARRGIVSIVAVLLLSAALLAAVGVFLGRRIGATISAVVAEARKLTEAVARGMLDVRGDATRIDAEFRPIISGFNQTMDAFSRPIQLTTQYVTRIARGELPEKIAERYEGDFDAIKQSLNTCIETLEALDADAVKLADAAVHGHLDVRADAKRHQGTFRRIVEGVNRTIDTLVGHLDAIPSPAMIIGADHEVRYLNPAGLRMVGRSREEAVGAPCSTLFKSDACGTGSCVCARAMQENRTASSETIAHPGGKSVDLAHAGVPLRDPSGKVIGAFEVFNDQTAVQDAVRHSRKVADYQSKETDRIVAALEGFSRGELELDATVDAGDADTAQVRAVYETIAKAIVRSADAVRALAGDAGALAEAAVAGKLSARADASRHQGDFRKIVEGVNRTLDAVLAPVNEAAQVLERLAARDLRARVQGDYLGDHARITQSVNATGLALHDALAQVASAVEQVSSAATQIAASSQAVASGASEQASSLEETSRTIESVAAMTRSAADNAQQANTLAQSARSAATEGAAAVEQMQGAMGKIRHSAESTSQIIKDVSDIAFQTNLLALNAAVEAARAGEAGRGFAVVAEEVRSLALRAKEAATKTEELIRQSVKQTGEGEVAARHVAEKLGEILGGVGKVTDIVAEIAAAAKEQTTGIGQVNEAVGEMDKVTQQNAASAEESSSAASELSGQAEELAAMVGAFQLERSQRASAVAPSCALPLRKASVANGGANGKSGRAAGLASRAALAEKAFPMAMDDLKDF